MSQDMNQESKDKFLLPDLFYHKEHEWIKIDGHEARVGITDFFQHIVGEVGYVELPRPGRKVKREEEVGTVETGKWVGQIIAPLSGTILEANIEVEMTPNLINQDPYGKGWLFSLAIDNISELKDLMDAKEAHHWLQEEVKKYPQGDLFGEE